MKKYLSFDDVLVLPNFSSVKSRKDVSLDQTFCGLDLKLPIISSNMDTITSPAMANAMKTQGGVAAHHRFCSIEENVKNYCEGPSTAFVSVGVGEKELERAEALYEVGADVFILDLAHGASTNAVNQVKELRKLLGNNFKLIVGNFATAQSIKDFQHCLGKSTIDAWKIGIGSGSLCTTRVQTGCGLPTLASLLDCKELGLSLVADGGIKNSGDIVKALVAGASTVMIGNLLAGTDETPGEVIDCKRLDYSTIVKYQDLNLPTKGMWKKYRGSASAESYVVQNKESSWRTAEGESSLVAYKGPVKNVLQQLEGGIRSGMSYVGANSLQELREAGELVEITGNGNLESKAHGKK